MHVIVKQFAKNANCICLNSCCLCEPVHFLHKLTVCLEKSQLCFLLLVLFGTFLHFLNNFFRRYEVQNAVGSHFVAHVLETGPEVVNSVINKQKTIVYCSHRFKGQVWVLFVMQVCCGLEIWRDTWRVDCRRNSFCSHCCKFQYFDSCERINEHNRPFC